MTNPTLLGGNVMGMGLNAEVIEISHNDKKVFNLEEARKLLPVVRKVTANVAEKVEALLLKLESANLDDKESITQTEQVANELIQKWHEKMAKLGVRAKGLWYVDFDNGDGYYCWRFPESDFFYKHGYQDGFTGRTLIDKSRPLPQEALECQHGHEEQEITWIENSSGSDQFSPWGL